LQPGQHGIEKRIAQAGGRPKKTRAAAGHSLNAVLGARNLRAHAARTHQREIMPMPLAMILNVVTVPHDFACQVRVAFDSFTDAKKSRLRTVLGQLQQNLRGHLGVRAVVDGNGDGPRCSGFRGQASPVRSQQPAARPKSGGGQDCMVQHHGSQRPGPCTRACQRRRRRTQMHGGGRIQ
jgi:hypothetical protein